MIISLWALNESYQALARLAGNEFPKDRHQIAYRISRVIKSAKSEMETLGESLNGLMLKCGITPGEHNANPEILSDFNEQAKRFMRETEIEIWGGPILFDEIAGAISITPMDICLLDWLIIEEKSEARAHMA